MSASGELAAGLRAWRERLTPQAADLPANSARRTSGLRREELAVLAGVSVDYGVRLEQGRASAPSAQVCGALARALRLTDAEQEHLFRLAGHATGGGRVNRLVPASIRRLVERSADRPVAVFDAGWTHLLWNPMWAALMGDPTSLPEGERNVLWLHFVGPSDCRVRRSTATTAFDASMVADLRRSVGRYPDDHSLRQLVDKLSARSARFSALWQRHEIAEHGPALKTIDHPDVGSLELDCDILTTQRGDLRVVMYTAEPGSESSTKLTLLATIGTTTW
ncbi:helix-turn-helix transcriptional regulator [Actinocorallia sp. A-T 12471]|uniref:helix-turn-helix transcriptional regulator n=1 Tax=Actinocorallia sp. A-T 12471 TaxID=3089813 RepID=UPI0029CED208|nr:helix-turn-helix transcriptional regulator [Actinocorallia sp. A-T 12471]MDX6738572.1 helix-turn-helix transcriptional regulator [Actinocorallia sp. A-T 12471]